MNFEGQIDPQLDSLFKISMSQFGQTKATSKSTEKKDSNKEMEKSLTESKNVVVDTISSVPESLVSQNELRASKVKINKLNSSKRKINENDDSKKKAKVDSNDTDTSKSIKKSKSKSKKSDTNSSTGHEVESTKISDAEIKAKKDRGAKNPKGKDLSVGIETDSKKLNENSSETKPDELDKDISEIKSTSKKVKSDPEEEKRTVFVGNLSIGVVDKAGLKELKKLFGACGKIECIRFRSVAFQKPLSQKYRKREFINQSFHPDRDSLNAYIRFENEEFAVKALTLNASEFLGKHIRVDSVFKENKTHDKRRSVFVGNLAFNVTEEEIRKFFDKCGQIINVRVIRDAATNVGKGFGYVQFEERGAVSNALVLDGTDLKIHDGTKRPIRVQKCIDATKLKEKNAKKPITVKNNGSKGFELRAKKRDTIKKSIKSKTVVKNGKKKSTK